MQRITSPSECLATRSTIVWLMETSLPSSTRPAKSWMYMALSSLAVFFFFLIVSLNLPVLLPSPISHCQNPAIALPHMNKIIDQLEAKYGKTLLTRRIKNNSFASYTLFFILFLQILITPPPPPRRPAWNRRVPYWACWFGRHRHAKQHWNGRGPNRNMRRPGHPCWRNPWSRWWASGSYGIKNPSLAISIAKGLTLLTFPENSVEVIVDDNDDNADASRV